MAEQGVERIDQLIRYIDCALTHPRPLPVGKHEYNPSLHTVPEVRDLYHCLYKLYSEESSSVQFREPVNALELNIYRYYDVVKTPVSLRTVLDRIAGGQVYSNAAQVMSDVAQIWENCRLFNGNDHSLTKEARRCEEALERIRHDYAEDSIASEEDIEWLGNTAASWSDDRLLEFINNYLKKRGA
ncbi:hypothetical protein AGDE_06532 [Angomonas deanei]|nr:hypothetical protein AGDE_06532 [Angomonas deanei]|eukprot:EPY37402.1 hypothetical protein AGDE_06532 [Angomonas deanei]